MIAIAAIGNIVFFLVTQIILDRIRPIIDLSNNIPIFVHNKLNYFKGGLNNPMPNENEHNIRLTSVEITNLWLSYSNDSMAICVLKYFLAKVQDTEVRPIIEYALKLSTNHVERVTKIFNKENFPIPEGFKEEDVNVTAPPLYSDTFYLIYLQNMSRAGLIAYSLAVPLMARSDVLDFYSACLTSSMELNINASKVMLSKGIYSRAPYTSIPDKVEFIKKQNYLEGFFKFGDTRPLDVIEITAIFVCTMTNVLGKILLTGFSQVAKLKEVREFMYRGTRIAQKHIEVFGSLLQKDNLSSPATWDSEVTNSTVSPFSDKLMMYHTRVLSLASIANYGTSIAASSRHDITVMYARLTMEFGLFGDDGSNIMIENEWMEQPPLADNRKELARV
ncbi:DUF3231 family protein [Paenibacillus psychroresistens]|uniref:DUF3231 family protein n=1 Tax=Paenibacillus psychroresistens TaxID=1778678 RepID=A0A6B8RQW5_9BACL|nr:DUF3231 family protein [Paenibacillus psychroresistens]QGQ98102.1 DUF3231 family protein [Paenibacillus psychroresistens]